MLPFQDGEGFTSNGAHIVLKQAFGVHRFANRGRGGRRTVARVRSGRGGGQGWGWGDGAYRFAHTPGHANMPLVLTGSAHRQDQGGVLVRDALDQHLGRNRPALAKHIHTGGSAVIEDAPKQVDVAALGRNTSPQVPFHSRLATGAVF